MRRSFFEDLAHLERYEKPVILTFDDGYDDNYTLLLPLLQKYHMKATIFMIAGDIGGPHKLTQPQLRELTQSVSSASRATAGAIKIWRPWAGRRLSVSCCAASSL